MGSLLTKLIVKVLGGWSTIIPKLLRGAGEGEYGERVKAAYWWAAGKKTVTGLVLLAAGTALESICGSFPEYAWACPASKWVFDIGAILAGVGLIDGGVRSPWPDGTRSAQVDAARARAQELYGGQK